MANEFKKLQPEEYFRQHIDNGIRPDGRKSLSSVRNVSLSCGAITTAESSAIVRQGNTIMACGITIEMAPTKPDQPNKGFIVPNVELPPLCHPQFKPGPPSERAQVATQFIHDVIENSGLIDVKDLCIKEGKLAWVLNLDITCLNLDGNLLDASVKVLISALKNLKLPTVIFPDMEDQDIEQDLRNYIRVDSESRIPLKLYSVPISCTVALFEDKFLIDPTLEEEEMSSTCVTVVLDSENGDICHFLKAGGASVSREKLQECTAIAKKQAKQIRVMIDKAIAKESKK